MAKRRAIKRAAKSAVKQMKKTRGVAKGGMNNQNRSKGYATKYGSTKYIKYKGPKKRR